MKKFYAITMAVLVLLGSLCLPAYAEVTASGTTEVYVTIADQDGKLALAQEKITVTDADLDGVLTIHDALFCAHEAKYEGGAAAGYDAEFGTYGLSMTKLWGAENGGSYGYYVNNAAAWSLTDEIHSGDYLNAFVYTDLSTWSDTYCFFDVNTATVEQEDVLIVTLQAAGYDESYNPIIVPVQNAVITVDGVATAYTTDADGKVTLTFDRAGTFVIGAESEEARLVPPVLTVSVSEGVQEAPATADAGMVYVLLATAALGAMLVIVANSRRRYEI